MSAKVPKRQLTVIMFWRRSRMLLWQLCVGSAGFLERTEGSEIYLLARYFDFGDIVATLRNPDSLCAKLGFRGTECPLLTICNFPQVCPSDVRPVPVDAGDYVLRPFTGHVQPRKATRLIQLPVHADLAMHVTRVNGTGNAATASIASGGPPMEHPSGRVVFK